jgi:serine/threonine-protein kinase
VFGVLAIIAVLGGVAWALGGAGSLFGPGAVDVPNVVGKTAPAAASALSAAGLAPGTVTTATSDSVTIGSVISQSPPPGVQLRKGGKVSLVISTGPAMGAIPDLGGMTEADAIRAIQNDGFTIGPISRKASSTVANGQVISQEPKSGTNARKGTLVSFTVSTGKPMAAVPDVVGRTRSSAENKLSNAGFNPNVSTQFSDTVAAGLVISSDPSAGTQAVAGSTVTITVSKGPEFVKIPGSVIGKSEAAATTQLTNLGLQVTSSTVPSSTPPAGLVVSTDPVPGTSVKSGSTVKIFVGGP